MSEPHSPDLRLWIAPVAGRFYLRPAAAPETSGSTTLPGTAWVADLDAGEARVDLATWAADEVTESVALEHYRGVLSVGAARLETALDDASRSVGQVLPGLDALLARLGTDAGAGLDGPEALTLLTGRTRAQVEADPAGSRDAVLDALTSLMPATPSAGPAAPAASPDVQATPEEQAALGEILQRFTFGPSRADDARPESSTPVRPVPLADRSPQALLASLRRAVTALGQFEPPETRAETLSRYHADARAAIDRATAGWKPPMPTVEELLSMGDDQ